MLKNQIKTILLLGILTALFLVIGALIGGKIGLFIGLIFAFGTNFFSYWWSHKIVLRIYKAIEADKSKYSNLYSLVREITLYSKIPMPKVYIINTPQSNAFATGRNPKHAVVAVTTGLLDILNKDELKGVLAHEIAHIKNRDILISSVAATIAGIISYLAMMARFGAIFGGLGGRDRDNNIIELLALAIVAPIMAVIIQLAISRSREYLADETGAKLVRNPFSLASALEKIHKNVDHNSFKRMGSTDATAHMFIHSPFRGKAFLNMFSTHPPVEERIKRLKHLKV